MLKFYVRHSVREEFQKVSSPPKENAWIHGDVVNKGDLALLVDTYGMDPNILRDVLDRDELPRVEIRDGELYVFVRTALRGKHGQVITTPVLLALKGSVFANVSLAETESRELASPVIPTHATNNVGLLLGTFAAVVSDYEELIQHTARYIHDTGRRLKTHEVTNDDFIQFVTVEDNLNEYRMNLDGMLVVAERLRETLSHNHDIEAVEDIVLYIRQLLVAIKSHEQTITSIRNAYGTIANNVLNQRMKTLTVLTLLIALPNVFYGMYGMNIALPFAQEEWAYGAIVIFTLIVIVFVYFFAKKRNIF
jgi:magnesium transporter